MKKLLTIMISCSLALAASAMAQQDEASPQPHRNTQGPSSARRNKRILT
jgi:hypothetical protein